MVRRTVPLAVAVASFACFGGGSKELPPGATGGPRPTLSDDGSGGSGSPESSGGPPPGTTNGTTTGTSATSTSSGGPTTGGAGVCPNGVVEEGEDCDGADLAGKTCESFGFTGGTPVCTERCVIDTSSCDGCGNGRIDANEQCDGAEIGGATCLSLGFGDGPVVCDQTCMMDTSMCSTQPVCGNGTREYPAEECDMADMASFTCANFPGLAGPGLRCGPDCKFDRSMCCGASGAACTDNTQCCSGECRGFTGCG